jgi:hypothetical protein
VGSHLFHSDPGFFSNHLRSYLIAVKNIHSDPWEITKGGGVEWVMSPLDVLRALLARFGLDIQIGNRVARLVIQESIPVSGPATRIVKALAPSREGILQAYLKLGEVDGHTVAKVALAFALDKSAYLAWARQHGSWVP